MKKLILFLPLILLLVPYAYAGISFQPDIMGDIGFSYDPVEYSYSLTYKQYYLTVQPYVVYDGETYTLKQIIPYIEANYPSVTYRQTVLKFAKYHRWGYYLEHLPSELSNGLQAVGYRLVDTNIPLSYIDVEIDNEFNTIKLIFRNGFTLDFSDLMSRYDVAINRTHIHVSGVSGLAEIDMDPITYASPTITVTGTNGGSPWTFWDLWNASNVNGWGVVSNNNNTDTQYSFNCRIVIGDGSTPTNFTDGEVQITYEGTLSPFIKALNNAVVTLGEDSNTGRKGCDFVTVNKGSNINLLRVDLGDTGVISTYGCTFRGTHSGGLLTIYHSNGDVKNCYLEDVYPTYIEGGTTFANNINVNSRYGWQYNEAELVNYTIIGCEAQIARVGSGWTGSLDNLRIISFTGTTTIYVFSMNAPVEYNATNVVNDVWATRFESSSGHLNRQYSWGSLVKDNVGAPIANATVTLYRSSGVIEFNVVTGVDGRIAEQTVTRGYYYAPSLIGVTDGLFNDYGPFRLHVEAEGYTDYDIFNIVLDEPTSWELTLVDASDSSSWLIYLAIVTGLLLMVAQRFSGRRR